MNCTEFVEHLQHRLDGANVDFSAARAHALCCDACRELETAAGRLMRGIGTQRVPPPPASLAADTTRRIVLEQRRLRRQRRLLYVCSAAAAVIALCFFVRERYVFTELAPAKSPSATVSSLPVLSVNDRVAEASNAVVVLTERAASETFAKSRLILEVSLPKESYRSPLLPDPALQPLREVEAGVSEGLEPVATSARRAMHFFWKELAPRDRSGKVDM